MFRIMIADDEPIMPKALVSLVDWSALDCEVVSVVADGQAAVDALVTHKPDIVIADIKMPVKTGIDVAEYIYKNRLPVKVILLTAFAEFAYAQQAIRYGVTEYLIKNGAVEGIADAVKKCQVQLRAEQQSKKHEDKTVVGFLKALLEGSLYDEIEITKQAIHFQMDTCRFAVVTIEILPNHSDIPEHREMSLMAENLKNLLQEVLPAQTVYFLPLGKNQFCGIAQMPTQELVSCYTSVAETFSNLTGYPVYMGTTIGTSNIHGLKTAYAQAKTAIEQRFFTANIPVHQWREVPALPKNWNRKWSLALEHLSTALSRADIEETEQELETIFTLWQERSVTQEAKDQAMAILTLSEKQMMLADAPLEELNPLLGEYKNALDNCCFFTDFQNILRELLTDCCRVMADTRQSGNNIIAQTQDYIDKHYTRSLSLGEIADFVGVSSSYLSRLYKSKTGITLVEAINKRKIEKAQELLLDKNRKVYEAAYAVGIEDTAYFSHMFRKHTGISPKAYQEARQKPST